MLIVPKLGGGRTPLDRGEGEELVDVSGVVVPPQHLEGGGQEGLVKPPAIECFKTGPMTTITLLPTLGLVCMLGCLRS